MDRESCNAGDPGSIPGLGRFPGKGNGNLLQYSCLKNPMDREAWQATVHRVARVRHDLAAKLSELFNRVNYSWFPWTLLVGHLLKSKFSWAMSHQVSGFLTQKL